MLKWTNGSDTLLAMKHTRNVSTFVTGCAIAVQLVLLGLQCEAASGRNRDGWVLDAVVAASNALADIERVYPDGGDPVIHGVVALGKAHMDALQYEQAEQQFLRAIESHRGVFKDVGDSFRHDLLIHIKLLSGLADSQMKQGKFEEATHNFRRGLHAAKLGVGASTPEVKHLRTGLVLAVARRSTVEAAESLFTQLLAASEEASGFIHDDTAMILDHWIEFRAQTSRITECEEMATRLIDVLKRVYGNDHPAVAEALNRHASIIYAKSESRGEGKGEGKKALPSLREASQIRRAAFGPSHPLTKRSEENLEQLLRELYEKRLL